MSVEGLDTSSHKTTFQKHKTWRLSRLTCSFGSTFIQAIEMMLWCSKNLKDFVFQRAWSSKSSKDCQYCEYYLCLCMTFSLQEKNVRRLILVVLVPCVYLDQTKMSLKNKLLRLLGSFFYCIQTARTILGTAEEIYSSNTLCFLILTTYMTIHCFLEQNVIGFIIRRIWNKTCKGQRRQ